MKILLTGASGFLGSEISSIGIEKGYDIIKLCCSPRDGFVSLDLTSSEDLEKIRQRDWDIVIHTVACTDLDRCQTDKEYTYLMNVNAGAKIAEFAADRNAKMVFISSNYVFDGYNPPYYETSETKPLNYYGITKLEAEQKILNKCKNAIIIRIPRLYSVCGGINSLFMLPLLKAINDKKEVFIDNVVTKYPTNISDVSNAIFYLLEKNFSGIIHVSADEGVSKYTAVKLLAKFMDLDSSHVKSLNKEYTGLVTRPVNPKLNTNKILSLGFSELLPFSEYIKNISSY